MHGRTERAAERARRFLLDRQADDGLWRDYDLEPGASEAWTTAVVATALLVTRPATAAPGAVVDRALSALETLRVPGSGWGYNRRTAADADTTSWVLRLLSLAGRQTAGEAVGLLAPFLSGSGRARTFASAERFGAWGETHDDVTALVGLALAAAGAPEPWTGRVRRAVLTAGASSAGWRSYWWQDDDYGTARSLECLAVTGGIPRPLALREAERLDRAVAAPAPHPFNAAQRLSIATSLDRSEHTVRRAREHLLDWQDADGSWPPSPVLRVPAQVSSESAPTPVYADVRCLFGTALALLALAGCHGG